MFLYFATMTAYYSILGLSYGVYYALVSESHLTFWLRRGCALGHDELKASALDVVHPEGKGKGNPLHSCNRYLYDEGLCPLWQKEEESS